MTVKELKELLECIIEDGKEEYIVFGDELVEEYDIYISDKNKVVYL